MSNTPIKKDAKVDPRQVVNIIFKHPKSNSWWYNPDKRTLLMLVIIIVMTLTIVFGTQNFASMQISSNCNVIKPEAENDICKSAKSYLALSKDGYNFVIFIGLTFAGVFGIVSGFVSIRTPFDAPPELNKGIQALISPNSDYNDFLLFISKFHSVMSGNQILNSSITNNPLDPDYFNWSLIDSYTNTNTVVKAFVSSSGEFTGSKRNLIEQTILSSIDNSNYLNSNYPNNDYYPNTKIISRFYEVCFILAINLDKKIVAKLALFETMDTLNIFDKFALLKLELPITNNANIVIYDNNVQIVIKRWEEYCCLINSAKSVNDVIKEYFPNYPATSPLGDIVKYQELFFKLFGGI